MADAPDLFARRNRTRIIAVMLVATINYMLAVALAGVAVGVGVVLTIVFGLDVFPDDLDTLKYLGIGIAAIAAVSFVVGLVVAIVKIPFARRSLERRVLRETGAQLVHGEEHREVRNLLDGLAIASGLPAAASPDRSDRPGPRRTRSASGPDPRTRSSASRPGSASG